MDKKYLLGIYEKALPNLSLDKKLEMAKNFGYDFLEISIDETDEKLDRLNMSYEDRQKIINFMNISNCPIRSMCLSGHRKYPLGSVDIDIQKKSLEIMKKAIYLADDLGIRLIQLAGYDVYYEKSNEETKKIFEENLIKSVNMAAKYGISLGFETMETEFMNTVKKAMNYVKKINSPYLGVYPDIGNLTNAALLYNSDILSDIKEGLGHTFAIHIKETIMGKFREIPFGRGHVNFEAVIKEAFNINVRRFVTEFWYINDENLKKEIDFIFGKIIPILDKL